MAKTTIPVELSSTPGITDNSNATAITIDSSGLVGIGQTPVTNDGAMLQITGNEGIQLKRSGQTNGFLLRPNASTDGLRFSLANVGDRMVIDASGKVGIGENSPSKLLHIASDTDYEGIQIKGAGHKQLTIESTSSSKQSLVTFTTASQNMSIGLDTDNAFIFHSGTASTERMRIDSSGNLLVGTTTALSSSNSGGACFLGLTQGRKQLQLGHTSSSSLAVAQFFGNSSTVTAGSITCNASATAYNTSSDYRLKENVVEMTDALNKVNQLQPKRFNFIADETNTLVDGFLAHEVQDIVPEAISGEKDAVDDEGNPEYQGIDQSKLVPLLTKAIQEQQEQIETLKQEIREIREGG